MLEIRLNKSDFKRAKTGQMVSILVPANAYWKNKLFYSRDLRCVERIEGLNTRLSWEGEFLFRLNRSKTTLRGFVTDIFLQDFCINKGFAIEFKIMEENDGTENA